MKQLSAKVAAIAPSATLEITNKAKKMQREGIDVISLSIGEPDFDTPKHITDACIDALKKGETHYAPSNGIPELLAAISGKIVKENKFPCEPDQAIVTCGAKDAIYEGMEAVLNPGDEVILPTPAWVSYEPCVQMAGGKTVLHPVNQKTFQLDDSILEKVNTKTKMISINSPSNP
ncbi:MAG: aminotransferase class I/II-fold pyridoxal phosphate-dependent enzyme, partial [Methanoregula sp.]